MRVFADCCVNGIKRFSKDYYGGSWDACEKAAETIRERIRGDIKVLANRPGEIRIYLEDPRTNVSLVIIDAVLALDIWTDGIAEVFCIRVENKSNMWYPTLESSDSNNQPGEE